jgi:hypothetical protein
MSNTPTMYIGETKKVSFVLKKTDGTFWINTDFSNVIAVIGAGEKEIATYKLNNEVSAAYEITYTSGTKKFSFAISRQDSQKIPSGPLYLEVLTKKADAQLSEGYVTVLRVQIFNVVTAVSKKIIV